VAASTYALKNEQFLLGQPVLHKLTKKSVK